MAEFRSKKVLRSFGGDVHELCFGRNQDELGGELKGEKPRREEDGVHAQFGAVEEAGSGDSSGKRRQGRRPGVYQAGRKLGHDQAPEAAYE